MSAPGGEFGKPAPTIGSRMVAELLRHCEEKDASDLHLAPGHVPLVRIDGDLVPVEGRGVIHGEETVGMSEALMNSGQRAALNERGAADGACSSPGGARFRFNIFRRQGKRTIILRRLEDRFRSLKELGLPNELYKLADLRDGLVVVSGPTGAGKSTTLATLLDKINRERNCHIITIEDPVEYLHDPKKAEVNQRELYTDVPDFNEALVSALREDPDVILVGEVRDLKTIRMAITAAETGHLVYTTVHAGDCVGTIERLTGVFPAEEQDGIRRQIAMVLRAVVNQQLLPSKRADGRRGRVAAAEVMMNTPAIANLIVLGKTNMISSFMETGRAAGMQTFDQDVARLLVQGLIDEQTAVASCRNVTVMRERVRFLQSGAAATAPATAKKSIWDEE
ncbi:MAG TPA: PilT/PilU family type 4a pilus ATPase [Phycisphaerae bacterium]|jgi:twitching motility protein PilT|nr:PilT/PilU family type 4a pilus ATPase [Phycisphaerae bacterium]